MSNLQNAIKALAPKKKFKVVLEETNSYIEEIEAIDETEAENTMRDMYNEGRIRTTDTNTEIMVDPI